MHSQTGFKTSRNNVSVRSRNSLLKQGNTQSFHGTVNNEYYQTGLKSPKSGSTPQQEEFSPIKKINLQPNTTKHSNEYYVKGSESFIPNWNRKKIVRNTSSNLHTETTVEKHIVTTGGSIDENAFKGSSLHEFKLKASTDFTSFDLVLIKLASKKPSALDTNPAFDLVSIENLPKTNDGPLSATSPRFRIKEEVGSAKSKTTRAPEYYSSLGGMSKEQLNTEESPVTTGKAENESRPTTTSNRVSSQTGVSNNPWDGVKLPVDPQYVLQNFASSLSPYEKEEITKYSQIYYVSDIYHKLLARNDSEYDDDRGDYLVVKNDHIRYRYEALEMLGRGSFGQVLKVYDHKRKEYAAVKVIRSPKKFHYQAKIEIRVLRYMMENYGADYNVIGLRDYFLFRNHVCLVFDLMDVNLYDLLKKNKFKGFPLNTVRKFAIQILYALKFLNHHKIVHCDLKPENILLKHPNKTGVKLIDFGSSCFENEKLYTYIQSRFYRSPEIILGLAYNTQIDMWSFGCLLCELYLGYPIFAGDSERDQLLSMFEVLGLPDKSLINSAPRKAKFFDEEMNPTLLPNTKGKVRTPNGTPLTSFIKPEDDKFLDLIKHCLEFDPQKRFNPDQALAHEWIIEGLPAQLQAQHLKFIKDTTPIDPKAPPSPTSKHSEPKSSGRADHSISYNPDALTLRSQYIGTGSEKPQVPNLSIRANTHNTQEDQSVDRSNEAQGQGKQKKLFTRKLNGLQKEKLSLKTVYRIVDTDPKTTSAKIGVQHPLDKEFGSPASRKGANFYSFKANKISGPVSDLTRVVNTQKSLETEESTINSKGSMVTWEGGVKKGPLEINTHAKKSSNYFYFTPKATHSVERGASLKFDKDSVFGNQKASLLPSLKLSISQKKLNS